MLKREMDMTQGAIFKKLIIYALPLMATNILQLLFNATDVAVLGILVSDDAVAAVGSTGALINLIIGLFVGLSVGANVLVARFVGSHEKEKAEKVVGMSILLSVIIGACLSVVGFFCARTFLTWMACDADVIDMATKYMQIYFLGMPIILLYNFCASIMRAVGDTVRPLIYLVLGGVINVGMNVFFIMVLHNDVEGVAIATITSQAISAVLAVISLLKSKGYARLDLRKLRLYKEEFKPLAKIGLPAGLQGCVFSLSNVVIQSTINSFGKTAMAGNTLASQFDGFIYNAMFAVALSCMSFVSQNLGAKNVKRVKRTVWLSLGLVTIVGVAVGGIILAIGRPLAGVIADGEEVVEYAMGRLYILATTYFLCGWMDVMSNTMRGLGKSTVAMVISLLGSCAFRIVWVNTVCRWFTDIDVLYVVFPVSWLLTFVIYLVTYFPTMKRLEKRLLKSAYEAEPAAENSCSANSEQNVSVVITADKTPQTVKK